MKSSTSCSWKREQDVVGLEEDVESLLHNAIFCEADSLSASCIVGMGGIGKTTLAKEVFNHPAMADRFDHRAWVSVSTEFCQKDLLLELSRQILEKDNLLLENMESVDDQSLLIKMLYQHLQSSRYFIVLDDVWDVRDLKAVFKSFPFREKASRLLLTSRTRNIIEDAHYIHEMKILDPNKSWQLFLKMVFTGDHPKCPNHLEKIGREILKKCNGLPLAIKVVGSQLAIKRQSESVWETFLQSIDFSAVAAELELSYVKLPPQLKSCFLCLGFFKEGTTVRVEKLVQVWNAGGMVSQLGVAKKQIKEELGRVYLDKLINHYMVQVKDMGRDSRVKNTRMNAYFHRLAITKAEEDIRFEILMKDENYRPTHKPRHRVIYCTREKFNYSTNQDKHLFSLFFHGGGNFDASPSYWKRFERLRTLDLEGFGLKTLPEMVGSLTRLRYLGLRNNYLQELPLTLGHLKKLEVLDIALNFMVQIPNIIWEMHSLRHLYMSDIICRKPLKIDTLKHLETLTYISVDNRKYKLLGLQMMTSLRKLGIEELDGTSNISKLFASLAKLDKLDCLILRGFRFRSMPSLDELGVLRRLTQLKLDGLLTKLPSADNFPPNIRYLTLVNSSLDEDPMPELGKLSKLFYLKLRNAFTGEQMMVSHHMFGELQVLCIGEMWRLKKLRVGQGAMQMLKRLEISNCPNLEILPEEIGSMSSLVELKMVTTKNIAAMIRESGLTSKIRHVDIQP